MPTKERTATDVVAAQKVSNLYSGRPKKGEKIRPRFQGNVYRSTVMTVFHIFLTVSRKSVTAQKDRIYLFAGWMTISKKRRQHLIRLDEMMWRIVDVIELDWDFWTEEDELIS